MLLVSILMTAYNREKFIGEAIESVLASVYPHFELIIVDDGSEDKTVSIAQYYESKDSRVQVYINERNLGDYPNRNKAASYAKGDLLMYVDSDDTIQHDTIAYVVNAFMKHEKSDFATIYRGKDIIEPTVLSSQRIIHINFFVRSVLHFGPGGTVVRREFFNRIGGFPERYGPANDMYYNIKASSNSSVILLPYDYLNYRIHDGQESNNSYSYLYQGYRYFQDMLQLKELPLDRDQRRYLELKSKRRFLVNCFKYFRNTYDLKKSIKAFQLVNFKISDFIQGIFN